MCVVGDFPQLSNPSPEVRELGRGPDSSQALARPQTPEPSACFLGWGRRGLCTIVIGQGVLGRTRGFFFPQLQTHFSKWSRLPLLLSWASRAGARLARPGFPDAWPSEPSFTVPLAFGVLAFVASATLTHVSASGSSCLSLLASLSLMSSVSLSVYPGSCPSFWVSLSVSPGIGTAVPVLSSLYTVEYSPSLGWTLWGRSQYLALQRIM